MGKKNQYNLFLNIKADYLMAAPDVISAADGLQVPP